MKVMSSRIPIAIVLGGIILAVAVYVSIPKVVHKAVGDPSLVRPVSSSDHILGNPAAKVTIVEYTDFQCDFCKGFHDTIHQVLATEGTTGQVAWVLRQFPLTEIHADAMQHALASECVAQVAGNDTFWKFADQLFSNQPVDPSEYGTLAANAGVSGTAFASCYASASTTLTARIMADRKNALDVGAQGTPYSLLLVDGKAPIVMDGAYSYDAAKQLVDEALAN